MTTIQRSVVWLGLVVLVGVSCGSDEAVESTTAAPTVTSTSQPPTTSTSQPPATTTSQPPVTTTVDAGETAEDECAHVIAATVESTSQGFMVSATVRSADTGWDKYADLWQVRTGAGDVLGERELAHPHETEQPFTRSLSGVQIPPDVNAVVIAARDSVLGFCGTEFTVEVEHE